MFSHLEQLPPDPLLGLIELYRKDNNPNKVDLGVGVYRNEQGVTPVLNAVKQAEKRIFDEETTKAYIGPSGSPEFNQTIQKLLFGSDHSAIKAGRIRTVQTPGGCGALRIGAELIKRCNEQATIWVSDPTWVNHVPLLKSAGIKLKTYPYYDINTNELSFDAMFEALKKVGKNDLVLLHGCCHNPSGADLTNEQWEMVADLAEKQGFVPFIDTAYQGYGDGLIEDAFGVRMLAERLPELIVASSCSKNFGLYRERVGSLNILGNNSKDADTSLSQMISVIRANYSMPPSHGAAIVSTILDDEDLTRVWKQELTEMRDRLNGMRALLVDKLTQAEAPKDFSFINNQKGMFSFLGISGEQVENLQKNHAIYMASSSRISIAGINTGNVDYLTNAIVSVL